MTAPDGLAALRAETTEALREAARAGRNVFISNPDADRLGVVTIDGEVEALADAVLPVLARLAQQRDAACAQVERALALLESSHHAWSGTGGAQFNAAIAVLCGDTKETEK